MPAASPMPTATGTTAAMVPIEVPMASETKPATRNSAGSRNCGGSAPRPSATTASTAPIDRVTLAKAPASRNTSTISITFGWPMPSSRVSSGRVPRRHSSSAPRASAGRTATGARSW